MQISGVDMRRRYAPSPAWAVMPDADFARGDPKIYSAPDYKRQSSAKAGLGDVDAVIEKGAGVQGGDALRFRSKNVRALFFPGARRW